MTSKRDLLVLSKRLGDDPVKLEQEVHLLDIILLQTETIRNLCVSCEVIDLNKYKIITQQEKIEKILKQRALKPFQFLFNKN
jgi:hypothetical protein